VRALADYLVPQPMEQWTIKQMLDRRALPGSNGESDDDVDF